MPVRFSLDPFVRLVDPATFPLTLAIALPFTNNVLPRLPDRFKLLLFVIFAAPVTFPLTFATE